MGESSGPDPFDFRWMVGRSVDVQFAEFDCWILSLGDSFCVCVDCPWRLLKGNKIAVCSADHGHPYGLPSPVDSAARANEALSGKRILDVEVGKGTLDLTIAFEGDLRFQVLPFSIGYEAWNVSGPCGIHVIAQASGRLSTYQVPEDRIVPLPVPAVPCAQCARPIPPARLESSPGTRLCVACQEKSEAPPPDWRQTDVKCPRCAGKGIAATLVTRNARDPENSGYFLGCSRYPECKYTE